MKHLFMAILLWPATFTNRDFKIVVATGNIIVHLVQSREESITVEQGDLANVCITQFGNKLKLSSSSNSAPVIVTVYFKDIYRILANHTATVETIGKLKLENLQVFLNDNARARIQGDIKSLYTVTNDYSQLKLTGRADAHILQKNESSTLKLERFLTLATKIKRGM